MNAFGSYQLLFAFFFLTGSILVRADDEYSCTNLQTGVGLAIHDNCITEVIADLTLDECRAEVDEDNVLVVHYRFSDSSCAIAEDCTHITPAFDENTWIFRYTCLTDCLNFKFTIQPFLKLSNNPPSIPITSLEVCINTCLETVGCGKIEYIRTFTQQTCAFDATCPSTCSAVPAWSLSSFVYARNCTYVLPTFSSNGLAGTTQSSTAFVTATASSSSSKTGPSTFMSTSSATMFGPTSTTMLSSPSSSSTETGTTTTLGPTSTTMLSSQSSFATETGTTKISSTVISTPSLSTETGTTAISSTVISTTSTDFEQSATGNTTASKPIQRLYIMPCICYPNKTFVGMSQEEIIEYLIAETKIDPKETHAAKNLLTSRSDPRASSRKIGIVGTIVLSLMFGTVVLLDAITLWSKLCVTRKVKVSKNLTNN